MNVLARYLDQAKPGNNFVPTYFDCAVDTGFADSPNGHPTVAGLMGFGYN